MSLLHLLRRFLLWWWEQLSTLLPARFRGDGTANADALVVSPIGPLGHSIEAVDVVLRRSGRERTVGRLPLNAASRDELTPVLGDPAVLRLAPADVLAKTITLPLAAQRELADVLGFEMDRETPFRADEIYWSHRITAADRHSGRLTVRLWLVPRPSLAPLLSALAEMGIVPGRAEIAAGPDAGCYLPLDGNDGRLSRSSQRLAWSAAICCAMLALAAAGIPFIQQSVTLARLDREVAEARSAAQKAQQLRHEIDRLSASASLIQTERAKAGSPLAVLAAATRILPDDTYLAEFDLRERKLTMSGRSAASARLIGLLAASHEFRNPAFAAPVTRLEAQRIEIFTIAAEVGP